MKCITRSACATGIFVTAIIVTLHLILGINPFKGAVGNKQWDYDLLTMGFIPDYIALGKTRILLRQKRSALLLIILDIGLSVLIASVCFIVMDSILVLWQYGQRPYEALSTAEDAWRVNMSQMVDPKRIFTYPPIFFYSTLLTSIWTTFILLGTAAFKLLVPLQRLTAWFFDIDKRTVQVIGVVGGALIMTTSIVWSLLHAALSSES